MSTRVQASKSNDDAVSVVAGKGKQRHSDGAVDDTITESTSSTQNLEKDRQSNDAIVINQAFKKLTQRERDELLMAKMKERMSGEGDERACANPRNAVSDLLSFTVWEDGEPPTSGLRRNVKTNMFRLI